MKSVRLHAPGDLRIHEEPAPAAGEREKIIRVKAVGICGSDLHWFLEGAIGDSKLDRALVLGHEFAGETDEGERVAADPAIPCGLCEFCQRGDPNLCSALIFAGHGTQDGALREWLAWHEKSVFPIPDSLTFADAAMLEPLGIALHAVDLGKLKVGMSVGVFGCGPIGLLIIQLARAMGAGNIIATDRLPHRVVAAKSLGAHHAILREAERVDGELLASNGGREVDVAFEAAGEQDAVDDAVAAVLPGGKVILVGIPAGDVTSFSASIARRKGLTIKLSRRMKHTYPRAIELVKSGAIDVRSLVTHSFPLEKVDEAFRVAAKREGLKIMMEL